MHIVFFHSTMPGRTRFFQANGSVAVLMLTAALEPTKKDGAGLGPASLKRHTDGRSVWYLCDLAPTQE